MRNVYGQNMQVMGVNKGLAGIGRNILIILLSTILALGSFSCAKPTAPQALITEDKSEPNRLGGQLEEVSPPETLQTLKQIIDAYDPQVRILSPRPGEVVEDTSVAVRFQVRGLPLFKDQQWGLGPHLHVFLDDEPYRAVYDLSEPLVLSDLAPGTHTLRVFASRPWHESFKNQGAFDQRTFHVFAQTPQKALDKNQPLLTYSRPQGSYGAEPIMLDFYLTNAPLHMIAQESHQDAIADWRIRCTINGQSFVFDQWQPVYLQGFKPGQNWVQLELIDENGNLIENAFNNTVRVITYEPGGDDTLSKLVRGELALAEVAGIIDPTYIPPVKAPPEEAAPNVLEPSPAEPTSPDEAVEPTSPGEASASPKEEAPAVEETPETEDLPSEPVEEPQVLAPASPETPTEDQTEETEEPTDTAELRSQKTSDLEPSQPNSPTQLAPEEPTSLPYDTENPAVEAPEASNAGEADSQAEVNSQDTVTPPNVDSFGNDVESPTNPEEPSPAEPSPEESLLEQPSAPQEDPTVLLPEKSTEVPAPKTSEDSAPEVLIPAVPPSETTDILDSAPTSSRFFNQFKQWRQKYQKQITPPEMKPSQDLRELPTSSAPAPSILEDGVAD